MIQQLITPIHDVMTALPFIERYGGVVKTARRSVQIGVTDQGQTILDEERFPVACSVTARECWEEERYQDLIPDDAYASIFYWEEIDGLRFEGVNPKLNSHAFYDFSARLRLVGWLNAPRLGYDGCALSAPIVLTLLKSLNVKYKQVTDPFEMVHLQFRVVGQEPKSQSPFDKYSYENLSELWMYPYDYLSLVVEVRATVGKDCLPAFVPEAALECVAF